MKTLSSICETTLETMKGEFKLVLCDYVMSPAGPHLMPNPVPSHEYECGYCGGNSHYTPYLDPASSDKRVWLCANTLCDVYTKKKHYVGTLTTPVPQRALEWAKFCEINGIGDLHHDVKFEKIEQSAGKIDYLLKFGIKPCGIIFMQGTPGSGKTYASMAVCELFTRKNTSAIFTTQKQMLNDWLDTFKSDRVSNFIDRVTSCNLLVIDDFGTGEVSSGFMSFFMDVINTRMQWSNRGTIITTNLNDKDFSNYCGNALNDRIRTGQLFEFKDKSRRKPTVL